MKQNDDYLDWLLRESYVRDGEATRWVDWIAAALLAAVLLLLLPPT